MLALENPHCGVSGVPFMNSTTGFEATALSIAPLVSVDSSRSCERVRRVRGGLEEVAAIGRDAWRNPFIVQHIDHCCATLVSPEKVSFSKSSSRFGVVEERSDGEFHIQ